MIGSKDFLHTLILIFGIQNAPTLPKLKAHFGGYKAGVLVLKYLRQNVTNTEALSNPRNKPVHMGDTIPSMVT